MLTIHNGTARRDCSGLSRRDFIRIGSLGLGGLTLSGLLSTRALGQQIGTSFLREKAVVFLYLSGGASHIETFNPNMDAPAPYHSLTGEVKTSVPGVTFGGSFPELAKHADRMAIVRSFRHSVGDHVAAHVHVLSGGTDPKGDQAHGSSMGSLFSRLRGATHPGSGLPTYSVLTQSEVDGQYSTERERALRGSWPGQFGAAYAPFVHTADDAGGKGKKKPSAPVVNGSVAADMQLSMPAERLRDRRSLLQSLDQLRRETDASGAVEAADKYDQQAMELILGSAATTFDLSKEDPRTIAAYDTSGIKVGHKSFRPSSLGSQLLLARRLCEAGCGFITVQSSGWDMHADNNNPNIVTGMNMLGSSLDKAVSAFLTDLEQRGLSDKVLLVITGDFGRTPKVNKNGGRDHWANLGTLAFAGGGLKLGGTVGRSDRNNGEPASDPVTPRMMMATIMHTLLDVGQLRVARGIPRELVSMFDEAQPIRELV